MRLREAIAAGVLALIAGQAPAQTHLPHAGRWSLAAQCPQTASLNFTMISGRNLPIEGPRVVWKGRFGSETLFDLDGGVEGDRLMLKGQVTNPRGFVYSIEFSGPIADGRFQVSGPSRADRSGLQAICEFTGWRTGP